MREVYVSAKQWRDKKYGNVYQSARVYVDDVLVGAIPFQYSGGDQYVYEAGKLLGRLGLLPDGVDDVRPMRQLRELGVSVVTQVQDAYKREAEAWGEGE
jgi:hypothetical protein